MKSDLRLKNNGSIIVTMRCFVNMLYCGLHVVYVQQIVIYHRSKLIRRQQMVLCIYTCVTMCIYFQD